MFKLVHKNKKGLSLYELIVTVAIVGLVVGIAGSALYMFQRQHTSTTHRWRIQNAVQLASTKFETRTDLIANSKMLDIFYDENIANGILYDETTNTFEWKDGKVPYVVPDEGEKDDDYSYIFSTPAWDKNDTDRYLGHFLFIKNFKETTSTLFLDDEGFGDTPVKVELSIATDYILPVVSQNEGESDEEYETRFANAVKDAQQTSSYQNNGVKLVMKSGNEDIIAYQVETVYILENFNSNKIVNVENNQLILKEEWVEGNVAKAYPCGWSDETINNGNKEMHGYPAMATNYGENNSKTYNFSNEQLQKTGNVLRFLSPLSDMKVEDGEGQGTTSHKASCIQTWLFSDGTASSERVLNNFRNFRDEVLRGTAIGDWFIDFYYNDLSPFMIENTAFMKPILKFVSKPLSYICDFIAGL